MKSCACSLVCVLVIVWHSSQGSPCLATKGQESLLYEHGMLLSYWLSTENTQLCVSRSWRVEKDWEVNARLVRKPSSQPAKDHPCEADLVGVGRPFMKGDPVQRRGEMTNLSSFFYSLFSFFFDHFILVSQHVITCCKVSLRPRHCSIAHFQAHTPPHPHTPTHTHYSYHKCIRIDSH